MDKRQQSEEANVLKFVKMSKRAYAPSKGMMNKTKLMNRS